jgi:hypothetical protein
LIVCSWTFPPSVEALPSGFDHEPLSFKVTNDSSVVVLEPNYSCDLVKFAAPGGTVNSARVRYNANRLRTLWFRESTTATCESSRAIDLPPFGGAKYRVTLMFKTPPWPLTRTRTYDFVAVIQNGAIRSWARN